ncbi:nucleoside hydrolase [Novosphingobium kaempferiae]|uniref:nucleoside hydrolase n=1 Tax=Novosphingobium kaempferiae TaxID=2896849 RepID=UPI001E43C12D|nr:nucleoside hydrolase [Novosphingobium kaempferiae]
MKLRKALGVIVAVAGLAMTPPALADAPAKNVPAKSAGAEKVRIFFDNDFLGPGQSNIQSMIPLLRDERVKLEGVGVVTGDAWRDEEVQHLLRFLEIAGRPEVKVYPGAEMPIMRNQAEMANWEARYGRIPFKGAWSTPRPGRTYHPEDPALIPPMPEGQPRLKAQDESAVMALIRTVRANPGQITVVSAGPLTNIALALRIAPDLPLLAKELVMEAGKVDTGFARATGNTDYSTDFNFLFDPEAAHIVLTAPWKKITAVGNVTAAAKATQELADRIAAPGKPVGTYFKTYARIGQPLWDEITVAVAIDRSLVTDELVARLDVDTLPGPSYGQSLIWKAEMAPAKGTRDVHIVRGIDVERFLATFTKQAQQ